MLLQVRCNFVYTNTDGAVREVGMAERTAGVELLHLRAWRARRLMTQTDLAQATGLSLFTVSRAERGGRVSFANVHKLAAALGVTTDDLRFRPPEQAP